EYAEAASLLEDMGKRKDSEAQERKLDRSSVAVAEQEGPELVEFLEPDTRKTEKSRRGFSLRTIYRRMMHWLDERE
ncbi:MAG: hypothetical protein ACK55I_43515, partial [bacterium]